MRYRDHPFWKLYENVTAVVGILALISLMYVTIGPIANETEMREYWPSWPLVGKATHWLIGSITWIIKFDWFKYPLTRDPRDHPFRKWWTFKEAKPRTIIVVRKGVDSGQQDLITTVCPSCDVLHGFEPDDTAPRVCGYEGCDEVFRSPHG